MASYGLRVFDFVNYYLPRYFSWVLLKQYEITGNLREWAHKDKGTIQFYEALLDTNDKFIIKRFLKGFLGAGKISRNDKCYCGSGKKLKYCHYEAAIFLKPTSKDSIEKGISFFS